MEDCLKRVRCGEVFKFKRKNTAEDEKAVNHRAS